MKWFRHQSDSHNNLKLEILLGEYGAKGYGVFWLCVELVAQQGKNFRITHEKEWKAHVALMTDIPNKDLTPILELMANCRLIDKKGLEKGDLFIPKMKDYEDEHTKRVRRGYGGGTST